MWEKWKTDGCDRSHLAKNEKILEIGNFFLIESDIFSVDRG